MKIKFWIEFRKESEKGTIERLPEAKSKRADGNQLNRNEMLINVEIRHVLDMQLLNRLR